MRAFLKNNYWKIIASIAVFSVSFFLIIGFVFPGSAVEEGIFDTSGDLLGTRSKAVQYLMNFLYFTFISNLIVMIISLFRVKNIQTKWVNIMMLIGAASITMTMLVYWIILFNPEVLNAWEIVNTVLAHLVVPIAFLIGFYVDIKNKVYTIKLPILKTALITLAFPIKWLAMSLILYYSLGGQVEHAIYGFLHHNGQTVITSLAYIIGIAIGFSIFSITFIKLYSLSTK